MWFVTGFITLAVFCITSLFWRQKVSWRGERRHADGIDYEVSLTLIKGRLDHIRVGISCGDDFSFTLTRERLHDVVSKKIGLVEECQTGDIDFDREVYIRSDDRIVHRLLQTDPTLRAGLLELIDACPYGLKSVEVHNGRLWIEAKPLGDSPEEAEVECARMAPLLKVAAERLKEPQSAVPESRDPFPFRAACLLAISTGLAINGFLSLFPLEPPPFPALVNPLAPLILAIPIGLCVSALLALAALAWLRRSARTHLVLIEILLAGSAGAVLTAYSEIRDFNIEHDTAAPSMIEASVTKLTTSGRTWARRGRNYHAELAGWPTATEQASLKIPSRIFNRLQVGQSVAVEQHPGALGWAWVSDFHPR